MGTPSPETDSGTAPKDQPEGGALLGCLGLLLVAGVFSLFLWGLYSLADLTGINEPDKPASTSEPAGPSKDVTRSWYEGKSFCSVTWSGPRQKWGDVICLDPDYNISQYDYDQPPP